MAKGALPGASNPLVLPDYNNSMDYECLRLMAQIENGYKEGCTRGAKQYKAGHSFKILKFFIRSDFICR